MYHKLLEFVRPVYVCVYKSGYNAAKLLLGHSVCVRWKVGGDGCFSCAADECARGLPVLLCVNVCAQQTSTMSLA